MKMYKLSLSATVLAIAPVLANAATLTNVPMQGGMIMPMVSYDASAGMMMVMMPTEAPQLTPLLVSNPGDSFQANDPWFAILDPSREGAAFSRRYGFMMDAMSDPLPVGTQMWIRKVSGPPDLRFYRYSASEPKSFEPIFGTNGSTNALSWDGVMFHPAVAAPPATNGYSATFEVYLAEMATGAEVPNSSSGPFQLNWANMSDGRPALTLAPKIMVAWPLGTARQWVLESADSITGETWTTVTNTPVTVDGEPSVVLSVGLAQRYFRMRYQP